MLSNLSPYSAQGLTSSFPSPFGQPSAMFGQDPTAALGPYGQGPLGSLNQNGFGQGPFGQGAFGNGMLGQAQGQGGFGQGGFGQGMFGQGGFSQGAFGQNPVTVHQTQQLIATLAQLAQQISAHSVGAQQVSLVLHQIVQHLALQHLYRQGGIGPGLQQGGGYAGFNPQIFAGFNPQAQAWGASRPNTIQ